MSSADSSTGVDPRVQRLAFAVALIPFVGVLGLPLGLRARRQVRQRDLVGGGLASAAVWLGAFWVVALLVAGLVWASKPESRDASGRVKSATEVAIERLRTGDCLAELGHQDSETLVVVPCSDPHPGEVFEVFNLPGVVYPGEDAVDAQARARCEARLSHYVGGDKRAKLFDLSLFAPGSQTWTEGGDRRVVCILSAADGHQLEGPARDSVDGQGA